MFANLSSIMVNILKYNDTFYDTFNGAATPFLDFGIKR